MTRDFEDILRIEDTLTSLLGDLKNIKEKSEDNEKIKADLKSKEAELEKNKSDKKELEEKLNKKEDEILELKNRLEDLEANKVDELEGELKKEKERLLDLKEEKEKEYRELEERKLLVDEKLSYYESTIDSAIEEVDEELVKDVLRTSVVNNLTGARESLSIDGKKPYIRENKVLESSLVVDDIDDFNIRLGKNYQAIGIIEEEAYYTANYLIGILSNNLIPLVAGYDTRKIVEAFSRLYSSETPYIISLVGDDYDYNKLNDLVKDAPSKVVLLEDALDHLDGLLPLLKDFKSGEYGSKKLFISTEYLEDIGNFSPNILNYIGLFRLVDFNLVDGEELEAANSIELLENFRKSCNYSMLESFSDGKSMLKRLTEDINIKEIYKELRSMTLIYAERASYGNIYANAHKNFESFFKFEFVILAKIRNIMEEVRTNIKRYSLGDELLLLSVEEYEYDFDDGLYTGFETDRDLLSNRSEDEEDLDDEVSHIEDEIEDDLEVEEESRKDSDLEDTMDTEGDSEPEEDSEDSEFNYRDENFQGFEDFDKAFEDLDQDLDLDSDQDDDFDDDFGGFDDFEKSLFEDH